MYLIHVDFHVYVISFQNASVLVDISEKTEALQKPK